MNERMDAINQVVTAVRSRRRVTVSSYDLRFDSQHCFCKERESNQALLSFSFHIPSHLTLQMCFK